VFVPSLLAAINGHAAHANLIDAVDEAMVDDSLGDPPGFA
jgi:hypothetical protein